MPDPTNAHLWQIYENINVRAAMIKSQNKYGKRAHGQFNSAGTGCGQAKYKWHLYLSSKMAKRSLTSSLIKSYLPCFLDPAYSVDFSKAGFETLKQTAITQNGAWVRIQNACAVFTTAIGIRWVTR